MRILFLAIILISASCYPFELSSITSGLISINKTEGHDYNFLYLVVSDNGSEISLKNIDYEGHVFFSYRDWSCKNELSNIRCKINTMNHSPEDFVKKNSSLDIGSCSQSVDMKDLISHDADPNFYVLENREKRSLFALDKKSCVIKKIVLGSEENTLQDQLGFYMGVSNGVVVYYIGDNDYPAWGGIGQFDLYERIGKNDNEVVNSGRFQVDVGMVDLSGTGVLAVVESVDRDVPKEKLNEMDTYKNYVCFYVQGNLRFSKKSCHDIIPLDKQNNSISIDSLAISNNGKYFALLYENENNEYEIHSYELKN